MKKILLVKPDFFDVPYTINPWMNQSVEVNKEKAVEQWKILYGELKKTGIKISTIKAKEGLYDMVFAANAGMAFKNVAIVSNFKDEQRKGESPLFCRWFKKNFKKVFILGQNSIWEGQACTVIWEKNAIFSLSSRSNKESYKEILDVWGLKDFDIRYIELIDPYFYHLDVCFNILDNSTVITCPLAFKTEDYEWIQEKFPNILEVTYDDGLNFACNCFVFKKTVFLNSSVSEDLLEKLRKYGYNTIALDVSEFIKSGGGVKCLIFEY